MSNYSIFLPSYSVGEECYKEIPYVTRKYGKKAVAIGGKTAMSKAKPELLKALEGTDFEIQDYTSEDVQGVGVYSYTVKYTDTAKSGGYTYAIHKIYKSADEYYNICGSVVDEASYSGIKSAIDSFGIAGESTLKAAAPVQSADDNTGAADGSTDGAQTDGQAATTDSSTADNSGSSTGSTNSGGFTQEQLTDTNQTRTIYRNSDGHPLVITPDGNGNWVDRDGNTYRFVNNEDVYDQNDVDYYWHGEGADVYYMPVE